MLSISASSSTQRRTRPPSSPATLSMKVHLDDEEWYNDSRRLVPENTEGDRETLKFVYQYHIATLPGG